MGCGTDDTSNEVSAGLPDITGSVDGVVFLTQDLSYSGALSAVVTRDAHWNMAGYEGNPGFSGYKVSVSASSANSLYGNSSTVQPPAYKVYAWKRIA